MMPQPCRWLKRGPGGSGKPRYEQVCAGAWTLWLADGLWRPEWWPEVEAALSKRRQAVRASRHARTVQLTLSGVVSAYLKVYDVGTWREQVKARIRGTRARNFLRLSRRLAAHGFGVPAVLLAGEERYRGRLRRALLLSENIPARSLPDVPLALASRPPGEWRQIKWRLLATLGTEVARFHALGYVHGDLVVTNLMLRWEPDDRVYFLDHDRTRRGLPWVRVARQRRNLVHLNRHEVPGLTHSDRFRFLVSYGQARRWDRARMRRQARWIARRTLIARAGRRHIPGLDPNPRTSERMKER